MKRKKSDGLALSQGKENRGQCTVANLKQMLFVRCGQVTGCDGKSLRANEQRKEVRAYVSIENFNAVHKVYFDRFKTNNWLFSKIDTSHRQTIGRIIASLVACSEFEPGLHQFFVEAK